GPAGGHHQLWTGIVEEKNGREKRGDATGGPRGIVEGSGPGARAGEHADGLKRGREFLWEERKLAAKHPASIERIRRGDEGIFGLDRQDRQRRQSRSRGQRISRGGKPGAGGEFQALA